MFQVFSNAYCYFQSLWLSENNQTISKYGSPYVHYISLGSSRPFEIGGLEMEGIPRLDNFSPQKSEKLKIFEIITVKMMLLHFTRALNLARMSLIIQDLGVA